jgi:hypothetical protein
MRVLLLLVACNHQPLPDLGDAGLTCAVSQFRPGFTFHVMNQSASTLRAPFGCGSAEPIAIVASDGPHPITPFTAVDHLGEPPSCDDIRTADCSGPFSDCGPGVGQYLAPGTSLDIPWDRRTYRIVDVASWCNLAKSTCTQCALSSLVMGAQQGRLTLCDDGMFMSMPPDGAGCINNARVVDFTFDASGPDATIVVN